MSSVLPVGDCKMESIDSGVSATPTTYFTRRMNRAPLPSANVALCLQGPPIQLFRSVALRVYGIRHSFGSPKEAMHEILADLGDIIIDPLPGSPEGSPPIRVDTTAFEIHSGDPWHNDCRGSAKIRLPSAWWYEGRADERWLVAVKSRLDEAGIECTWDGANGNDKATVLDFEWTRRIPDTAEPIDHPPPSEDKIKTTMRAFLTGVFPNTAFTRHVFWVKIDTDSKTIRGSTGINFPSIAKTVTSTEYDLSPYSGIMHRGYILRFSAPSSYIPPDSYCTLAINCENSYFPVELAETVLGQFATLFNRNNPARSGTFNNFRMCMADRWLVVTPTNPWIALALTEKRMPNGFYWQYVYELNAAPKNYNHNTAKQHAFPKNQDQIGSATVGTGRHVPAANKKRSTKPAAFYATSGNGSRDSTNRDMDSIVKQEGVGTRERTRAERHTAHTLKVYKGAITALWRGNWSFYINERIELGSPHTRIRPGRDNRGGSS